MQTGLITGRRGQRGFTLVELLVVVGIIALIAGILLPAVGKAIEQARKTEAKEAMHQLASGWNMYLAEYRQFPTDTNGLLVAFSEMDTNAVAVLMGTKFSSQKKLFVEFTNDEMQNGFLDPWGIRAYRDGDSSWQNRRYQLALDNGAGWDTTDPYDGKVTLPQYSQPLILSVALWSRGPDGVDNTPDDVVMK